MPKYATRKKSYSSRRARGRRTGRRTYGRMGTRRKLSNKNRPSVSIQRGKLSSDTQFLKLTYSQNITYVTGAGTASNNVWRGNSIFDPDLTGVGHQPRGRDQWVLLYDRYAVYGSSITALFSTDSLRPISVNVLSRAGVFVTPNTVISRDETKYNTTRILQSQGNGRVRISRYMSTAKIFGVPPAMIMTSQFATGMLSDTVRQWFWNVSVQDMDEVTVNTVNVFVTITYYCRLWERIIPGES